MDGQLSTWLMVFSTLVVVLTLPDGAVRRPRRARQSGEAQRGN